MATKRYWHSVDHSQHGAVESAEVDAFIEEVIAVSKKHGFSIGHEDGHGAFVISRYSEDDSDWLRDASLEGGVW